MRRNVLLPSIGCLGASGLTLLACSFFGISFGAFAQEPKSATARRTVRATIGSSPVARSPETVARTVSRLTQPRSARSHLPARAFVAGSTHVEAGNVEDKAAPLPPTKPTAPAPPPAAPAAVAQPAVPVAVAAPVLEPLPIPAVPAIAVPIRAPEVPAVVEELLP
jgi:hypothetical protein